MSRTRRLPTVEPGVSEPLEGEQPEDERPPERRRDDGEYAAENRERREREGKKPVTGESAASPHRKGRQSASLARPGTPPPTIASLLDRPRCRASRSLTSRASPSSLEEDDADGRQSALNEDLTNRSQAVPAGTPEAHDDEAALNRVGEHQRDGVLE